jgi:hypothetical protein
VGPKEVSRSIYKPAKNANRAKKWEKPATKRRRGRREKEANFERFTKTSGEKNKKQVNKQCTYHTMFPVRYLLIRFPLQPSVSKTSS